MEIGDKVSLGFFDDHYDFTFIGAGQSVFAFTRPEDATNEVWLVVPEHRFKDGSVFEDVSKDILVEAHKAAPDNPYLPSIDFCGADVVFGHPELDGVYAKIYRMKYYRDLIREDNEQWIQMKWLHRVRSVGKNIAYDAHKAVGGQDPSLSFLGNEAVKLSLESYGDKLDKTLVEALTHLHNSIISRNNPGLTCEFNLRNMGVDENGHLVLRDSVYDSSLTVRIKEDRAKE